MPVDTESLDQIIERWSISLDQLAAILGVEDMQIKQWQTDGHLPGRYSTQIMGLVDIDFLLAEHGRWPALAVREPRQDLGGRSILQCLQAGQSALDLLQLVEHNQVAKKIIGVHAY